MADINIKRYNGSSWEIHYPKTTIGQVINLSSQLANIQGDVDGLTENGKIKSSVLPDTFQNLTDGSSNLPYRFDLIVYGDSDKYYPVHFAQGNQNLLRTIKIWRSYAERAPNDWNTSTHKGSLNLEWKGNYGGWGGAVYNQWIYENTSQYTTLFAGTQLVDNSYAMAFFLRGGGTTGAIYHIASDQPLTWTSSYLTYTEPTAFYNQEKTFAYTNSSHDKYAPAPRTTVNTSQINSITVVKGGDSRLTNARTPTTHSHPKSQITNFDNEVLALSPAGARTPTAHSHTTADITALTGLPTTATGSISTTDSLNTALRKLQTQINSKTSNIGTVTQVKLDGTSYNPVSGVISLPAYPTVPTYSGSDSITLSGNSFQRAALTGDVTASANSNATTIASNAVTFAKMQNIETQKLLGRYSTGTGDVQPITIGSNLNLSTGGVLSATNTVYTHPGSGVTAGTYRSVTVNAQGHVTAGTNPTTLTGYGISLTGDVSNANNAITIKPKAITLAKIQDIPTDTVLGRTSTSSGSPQAIDMININQIKVSDLDESDLYALKTDTQTALNLKANDNQVVRATTENKNILGTTQEVFNISEKKVWFNKGALFYGTAAAAGLVTRGISGVTTDGSAKEHLYINFDGNNTLSRQLVLGAGSPGTDRGHGIYDYSAVRGDAFISYLTDTLGSYALKTDIPTVKTYSGSDSIKLNGTSFERAALTGDVTSSQNSNVTAIKNKAVKFAKIQDIATGKVLGRTTPNSGEVEELDLIDIGEITPSSWTQVWSGSINLNSYRSSFYIATVPSNSYIGKRIAIEVQYGSSTTYTSKIIFGVLGSSSTTAASTSISRGIGWSYFDGTNLRVKTLYTYTSTSNTTTIYVGNLKTLFGKFSGTTIDWSTSYSETLYMKKIWVVN